MSTARAVRTVDVPRKVPLFDLSRQSEQLGPRLAQRMATVLEHGQFILGPEVAELETALASYVGVRHAIGVSSGRDALIIALMALGVGPGDAVFIPALTFSATAGAVVAAGGVPVFVDIDADTFNMSAEQLDRAIERTKARGELRPKVVIPVDLYGLPADYDAIEDVARKHSLIVMADAAQSFGGAIGARRVGALGSISATSFYPTKPLGCFGDGGAIFTSDDDLAEAVRQIRSHGTKGSGDVAVRLGMTGRLDTLQAAVLLVKLEAFEERLTACRRIAARYEQGLRAVVRTPRTSNQFSSAWALYTIRTANRDGLREALARDDIDTGLYYRVPLHRHPAFESYLADGEKLPVSEQLSDEVVSLPIHPGLTDADVDRVIHAVVRAVQ
jgi:UDP-2-acetamido-2-deoxy-ribo-hexuluronate aminotransferase